MTTQSATPLPRSKRERASELLARPPLRHIARRAARWPGVIVFNYHRLGDRDAMPWDRTLYNADAATFESHVAALSRSAEIVALSDIPELARRGRRGRYVALTFDDGYRDNYEIAYPILRRHGASAAFFIATDYLDRPHLPWWDEIAWMVRHSDLPEITGVPGPGRTLSRDPGQLETTIETLVAHYKTLSGERTEAYLAAVCEATGGGRPGEAVARKLFLEWDAVREMRAGGMVMGGHTMSHPILARLGEDEQAREIEGCARRLADELGEPMRWFAYPVGSPDTFTTSTMRLLRAEGVELAFSFYGGFGSFSDDRPLDWPRMHVPYGAAPALLEAAVALPMLFSR